MNPYCWIPAKRRCLFFLFASTAFQIWHCAPVPHRNCRCGKRVPLSSESRTHRHNNRSPTGHISAPRILAFIHGSDCRSECRSDYPEQSHQFRFRHPNIFIRDIRQYYLTIFCCGYDNPFHTHAFKFIQVSSCR